MNALDDLRRLATHEIHRLEQKLTEAQSDLDSLKLVLTEIKWVQDEDEVKEI